MKLIAPELVSIDDSFKGMSNVLDFNWASDKVQANKFPAKVTISVSNNHLICEQQ